MDISVLKYRTSNNQIIQTTEVRKEPACNLCRFAWFEHSAHVCLSSSRGFGLDASGWLSHPGFICAEASPCHPGMGSCRDLVRVSVISLILGDGVIGPRPNPQPGGPRAVLSQASPPRPIRQG